MTEKHVELDEYQVYLEERKQLVTSERDTAQQFDKAILTLAAGALALSITFIHEIAPHPKLFSICFLIIAWGLFCLSLLSTLISFLTSQAACRRQREILDHDISGKTAVSTVNCGASWTNGLNYFSISFFILGIVFLITFSAINLSGGEKIMDDRKEQAGYVPPSQPVKPPVEQIGEGYVPPKPPINPPQQPTTDKK